MNSTIRLALMTTALVGMAGVASAAGTAPGVTVTNSVHLSYSSGGDTINVPNAAEASFVVDRKIDFSFQGQDAGSSVAVVQGSEDQYLIFRLENEGNDTSGYDVDLSRSGSIGLTHDPAGGLAEGTFAVYVGASAAPGDAGDALYDPTGTASLGDLAPDDVVYIKIRANIPDDVSDDDSDAFTLTATPLNAGTATPTVEVTGQGLSAVDTIFADPGADGSEAATETFVAQAPIISASAVPAVASENLDATFDCASDAAEGGALEVIPGSCLQYTVTVSNDPDASIAASNLVVTDILPNELSFASIYSMNGFDDVTEDSSTVTGTIGNLAPGATATFVIRASVD